MRQTNATALLEDEIHHLRLRLDLLDGDRRAYHEASQSTIKINKDEIIGLKSQQKALQEALARLRKVCMLDRQDSAVAMQAEDKVSQRACDSHKKHDSMTATVREKELKIQALKDELREATLETAAAISKSQEVHASKVTQALENRLDRAAIKFNEAQTIHKVYDEVITLFQQEQSRYDRDLEAFEKTLKTKKKEVADLETMRRDAHHAKELVRTELVKIEERVGNDRKFRTDDLQARKELAKSEMDSSQMLEIKSMMNNNIPVAMVSPVGLSTEADIERERQLQEMDEQLRHVKAVTGVNDIHEVLAKLTKQNDTHLQLTELRDTCESRLKSLKQIKHNLTMELEEARLTTESKCANSKKILEEMESQVRIQIRQTHEAERHFERETACLSKARAGVTHLASILHHVLNDENLLGDIKHDTLISKFEVCSGRIEELLVKVHGKQIKVEGELHSIPVNVPLVNLRVSMQPVDFERLADDGNESTDGEEDIVLDREAVKKESELTRTAKKQKRQGSGKRRKNKRDDGDNLSDF